MADTQPLTKASRAFTYLYPDMTPEAVLAFMVIASETSISLSEIGQLLGQDEAAVKKHLFLLATVADGGLVFVSGQNGAQTVALSPLGKTVAKRIELSI